MKLTIDLIEKSATFINAIREREIDLRSNRIPAIENLGYTKDHYDTIDLTDNEIRRFGNFPLLKRLRSIYLSNNRITKIDPNLEKSLPNLETLILNNNQLQELGDLDSLIGMKSLRCLSLVDNPVSQHPRYRLYLIHQLPFLRLLDFKRVKDQERREAAKIFGGEDGAKLIDELASQKTTYFEPNLVTSKIPNLPTLSAEEAQRIKTAISNATSLEEVTKLERLLKSGMIPE